MKTSHSENVSTVTISVLVLVFLLPIEYHRQLFCDFEKVRFFGRWTLYNISYDDAYKNHFMISLMVQMHLLDTGFNSYS